MAMQINDSQLIKFQKLYSSHFGVELSTEEATRQANMLLEMLKMTYVPITEEELKRLQRP